MARALALTQLLIVCLGGPILYLLVKVQHEHVRSHALANPAKFFAPHVLWLFAIPILYVAIATALRGRASEKAIQIAGIVLCAVLVLLLGTPIVLYLL
ncbi:MAG: hypothetical protein ACREKL_06425 [Chthoniobacterales bacterium]